MTKELIILGTGGNCIDILDAAYEINNSTPHTTYKCLGFLDDNKQNWGKDIHGVPVLGPLNMAHKYKDCLFVFGIGSQSNFWRRQEILGQTGLPPDRFETIIHPTATVSKMSRIGMGTVVFQNVTITSNVSIGNHVLLLPNTVVSHDCVIGDYTCVTGGVCISGEVEVGDSCYLGTNSTIREGVRIGNYCLIGMGSVVLDDAEDNAVMVGNPAKLLRISTEA